MGSFKMPSNTDVSSFMDKPGQFHLAIIAVDETPTSRAGQMMDALKVEFSVLAGTEPSQVKRATSQLFNNPSEAHKDGGEFCAKVQARLAKACGILPNAKPGEEITIDWPKMIGSQIIAHFKMEAGNDGVERCKVDGAHVYAVDDPDVAHVPVSDAALKLVPGLLDKVQKARKAAGAAAASSGTNGSEAKSKAKADKVSPAKQSPAATQAPTTQPATTATTTTVAGGDNDLDDLLN